MMFHLNVQDDNDDV